MIKELDIVVLTRDLPEHGLKRGDVGTVVMVYGDGKAFEVEFVSSDGETIALETLPDDHLVREAHDRIREDPEEK